MLTTTGTSHCKFYIANQYMRDSLLRTCDIFGHITLPTIYVATRLLLYSNVGSNPPDSY